jgi:putative tryptophan/tyrosine transport system substrate-binding protein
VDAILSGTSLIFNLRAQLIAITNGLRLPVAGHRAELAEAGALFSYGASLADQLQKAARMADKVLKGASTASLPVEQPTRFEFVVNQDAAARLGIKVPPPLLLRADRIIA